VAAPLHGLEELELDAAGPDAGPAVAGTKGTATGCGVGTTAPALPEEYDAAKPPDSTEPSAVKTTCMLPEFAVTVLGIALPLNDPSRGLLLLGPSYTLTKS
jgi:hypothetical protein